MFCLIPKEKKKQAKQTHYMKLLFKIIHKSHLKYLTRHFCGPTTIRTVFVSDSIRMK